ncbi:MAG: HAD-IIIA family hydrolase [Verrucomicrobia bacterium]|nr:HAD-IIIA family hydrolase [Verrucomicrobiota bacterium]
MRSCLFPKPTQLSASFVLWHFGMKCAVFFERDGVLNLVASGQRRQFTPLTLNEFHPNPAAEAPLRQLKSAGFLLFATSNQPGLSRGYQSRRELDRMHVVLRERFHLTDILVCPHDEMDDCPCRKPKAGLLLEAAFKWHIDLERSFVISDKWQDAQAAHVAGCTSLMIKSLWNGSGHHDFVVSDLGAAANKALALQLQVFCPSC